MSLSIGKNTAHYYKQIEDSNAKLLKDSTQGNIHDKKAKMAALTNNINSAKITAAFEHNIFQTRNDDVDRLLKEMGAA